MPRYFLAYLIPATAALGMLLGGSWSWVTPVVTFAAIPAVDWWLGADPRPIATPPTVRANLPLYLALPVQYGLIVLLATRLADTVEPVEYVGWIVSTGLASASLGIVVAHELVHRRNRIEYWCGKLLLLPVLYMHFAIEHVRGHHERVATSADPASAAGGVSLYRFLPRSVTGQLRSAWRLEAARLKRKDRPTLCRDNEMLGICAIQIIWMTGWAVFDLRVALALILTAAIAVSLLEIINYVEHYGLRRSTDANGRPEPVRAQHSWNSDHRASRAMLFELPRHTDHHMSGARPYSTLQSVPHAPHLPAGYPAMVLLALVPPLWFKVMDPRVQTVSRL